MRNKFYTFALMCILSVLGAASASAQVYKSVVPEPGSIVSSLRTVTITFADGSVVDFGAKYQDVTVAGGNNYSAQCTLAFGDADNQMICSFAEITDNGEYTINFPEGAIVENDKNVPAFTLTYTVGEDIEGTSAMTPAPGDVKWLYEFVYSNSAIDKNLSTNYGVKATVVTPSGATEELIAVYDWQIGEGKYRFQMRKLAVEKGEYTVIIPGDLLYYNNDNWERVFVPECTFKYNVVGGELTKFEATPSMEKPTTLFNQFDMTFPGYTSVEPNTASSITIWMDDKEYGVTSFSLDRGVTFEGNTMKYKNEYSSYIDPGVYYMTFPEGALLLGEDKEPCTPIFYEFKVVEPEEVNMVFTPADGASVNMLYHVIVNFPDVEKVNISNSPGAQLQYVSEDGTTYSVGSAYGVRNFTQINDNTWDISFNNMATLDGEYIILLQKNTFNFDGGFNQEATITVNFTAPTTVDPTIDPADGSALDKIQDFTISFPKESVVTLNPYLSNTSIDLYVGTELVDNGWGGYSNQKIGSASAYTLVEGTTNAFSFKLSAAALDKGEYLMVVPVGLFLIGEDNATYSSGAKYIFSATGEGLDKIDVYPAEAVNTLSDMSITYINESAIYLQNEWVGLSLYKEVEGQSWGTYLEFPSASNGGISIEGNVLKIKPEKEYTEDGRYYVDITAYTLFMSDGVTTSTPQRVYWTVDSTVGIESVNVDAAISRRIYNINGIEVKDMSQPGLYIRGGQKILVK